MLGLFIAVLSYELDLLFGGYKGIRTLHDSHHNSKALIAKAIGDRQHSPCTRELKFLNLVLCLLTIILILFLQKEKKEWVDKEFRKEIYNE